METPLENPEDIPRVLPQIELERFDKKAAEDARLLARERSKKSPERSEAFLRLAKRYMRPDIYEHFEIHLEGLD